MKLSEKILSLRTARGLSQGDLAEKLEVSRQSVSKWETGQSTPDLDKIIKLADLFGVSVDELVREGERPEPVKPEPVKPEPQVVYVEEQTQSQHRGAFVFGVLVEVLALVLLVIGLAGAASELLLLGLIPLVAGLPLLVARKYPWLIFVWLLVGMSYLILNPWTSSVSLVRALSGLLGGCLRRVDLIGVFRFGMLVGVSAATWYTLRKRK